MKTSLAPGSKVVTEYLAEAGLTPYLEKLSFHIVGYGCTTCIGNSGPLPQPVSDAIEANDLVVASVLSGNRNFEGRINPDVRANYLMSPPLVVAYALAGRIDIDLDKEPLGEGTDGKPVFLKRRLADEERGGRGREPGGQAGDVREVVRRRLRGGRALAEAERAARATPTSSRKRRPTSSTRPTSRGWPRRRAPSRDIAGARVLAVLGDSVTTDHISPAGSIKKDGPAGKYLVAHGVDAKDFNSYGARRGNHEVMVRGTFANVRLRNLLAPGTEGGVTATCPTAR